MTAHLADLHRAGLMGPRHVQKLDLISPMFVDATLDGVKESNTAAQNAEALNRAVTRALARPYGGMIALPGGGYNFSGAYPVAFPKTPGKFIGLTGEWGATTVLLDGNANPAFTAGSQVTQAGGSNFMARHVRFKGPGSTSGRVWGLNGANSARFYECHFEEMLQAVKMASSYAVEFDKSEFANVGGINVESSTHCHNLVVNNCNVFNAGVAAGGKFLGVTAGHTDNVVIRDTAFEYCRQVFDFADGHSATIFEGDYVEYCTVDPFGNGTGAFSMSMRNNWLALGASYGFANWQGGEFKNNRIHDQNIGFGTSVVNVDVAGNRLTGTSVVQSVPVRSFSTMLNGATADATNSPRFIKSGNKVQLFGRINNLPSNGSPVATLPADCWPLRTGRYACTGSTGFAYVIADSVNGNIVPTVTDSSGTVWLDGVSL